MKRSRFIHLVHRGLVEELYHSLKVQEFVLYLTDKYQNRIVYSTKDLNNNFSAIGGEKYENIIPDENPVLAEIYSTKDIMFQQEHYYIKGSEFAYLV